MNEVIATMVRSIFEKESLQDCSVAELQTIARQYPYFAPAQFLLAEKLKSTDEHSYKEQLHKLSLFFNNPLWLDYLINGYENNAVSAVPLEPPIEFHGKEQDEHLVGLTTGDLQQTQPLPSPIEIESEPAGVTAGHADLAPEIVMSEPQSETEVEPPSIARVEVEMQPTEQSSETHEEVHFADNSVSDELQEGVATRSEELSADVGTGHAAASMAESETPMPQLPDLKDQAEGELSFQPYHTVDYFASQGIKYSPEEKPADRFGQQLKSFTEWLKTLKRLPEAEAGKTTDPLAEHKVQQLADHSIIEGEVLTETMADVWLKQGNKEKAIETYNKLSLLNPAKSAYFASLIEQIKNS